MGCEGCLKSDQELMSMALSSFVLACYQCRDRANEYRASLYMGRALSKNEADLPRRQQEESK